jgi:hypothetical protein
MGFGCRPTRTYQRAPRPASDVHRGTSAAIPAENKRHSGQTNIPPVQLNVFVACSFAPRRTQVPQPPCSDQSFVRSWHFGRDNS